MNLKMLDERPQSDEWNRYVANWLVYFRLWMVLCYSAANVQS